MNVPGYKSEGLVNTKIHSEPSLPLILYHILTQPLFSIICLLLVKGHVNQLALIFARNLELFTMLVHVVEVLFSVISGTSTQTLKEKCGDGSGVEEE